MQPTEFIEGRETTQEIKRLFSWHKAFPFFTTGCAGPTGLQIPALTVLFSDPISKMVACSSLMKADLANRSCIHLLCR
jgi:hypothetical protein